MKDLIVIKIGGTAGDCLTAAFFQQIQTWQEEGKKLLIVHGGGHYISEMMLRLNVPVVHKNGLRVTTEEALKISQMVLIGQVQPMITSCFQQAGFSAVGLNTSSSKIIIGKYIDKETLGHVGTVTAIHEELLTDLLEKDYIPIVAPLGLTEDGSWLNINADEAACQIASALQAEKLILLTDVAGIKKEEKYLTDISLTDVQEMIQKEIITGGMIPKVKSAETAIQCGVESVCITNDILNSGTSIFREKVLL